MKIWNSIQQLFLWWKGNFGGSNSLNIVILYIFQICIFPKLFIICQFFLFLFAILWKHLQLWGCCCCWEKQFAIMPISDDLMIKEWSSWSWSWWQHDHIIYHLMIIMPIMPSCSSFLKYDGCGDDGVEE